MTKVAAVAAFAALLSGCAARSWRVVRSGNAVLLASPERKAKLVSPGTHGGTTHLDLTPGWRLRVITPILKSGGFQLPSVARQQGLTLDIDDSSYCSWIPPGIAVLGAGAGQHRWRGQVGTGERYREGGCRPR